MLNSFKRISIRGDGAVTIPRSAADFAAHDGADIVHPDACMRANTTEIAYLRNTMRIIRSAILSSTRRKNELAQIIAQAFGFDNTRVYVREKETIYLLGEHSIGNFRNESTYASGGKIKTGRNRILETLEEMSASGQYILRFDLRYALFLWEDDPFVEGLIKLFGLKRDEEQIELMRRIQPNKNDVLADINYYLFHNRYLQKVRADYTRTPLETTFIALINGEQRVHGYIMANNFITGHPLSYSEDDLRETAEVILDTYKIYAELEAEKRKALEAQRQLFVQNLELQKIAITDALLTDLFSRRYYNEMLPVELETATREGTNLGITFIDIDHFKQVNDTYGHAAGDEVLKGVAKIIKEECRKLDIPCRYGGEELVIVTTSVEHASELIALSRRIRERVNNTTFEYADDRINVTLSFGIAIGNTPEVTDNADTAVYQSKKRGRDKIVVFDPESSYMQTLPALGEPEDFIIFIGNEEPK